MAYLNVTNVKKLVKSLNRRSDKSFLLGLEIAVAETIRCACRQHNGGKKTLDDTILGLSKLGLK